MKSVTPESGVLNSYLNFYRVLFIYISLLTENKHLDNFVSKNKRKTRLLLSLRAAAILFIFVVI